MNDAVTMSVVSRNYFNMPAWIARDKGFMAAEGIDLGIAHIEAIEGANDMLRDGRAQFCYGVTEHAILDAEAGGSQRIVGGNVIRQDKRKLLGRLSFPTLEDGTDAAWQVKPRLEAQDRDGVIAELLYPTFGMVLCNHPDPDYKKASFDAYNRWLQGYVSSAPDRLIGVGQTPIRSVDEGEKRFVHEHDLEVFDMRYIDEMGMRHTMEQALSGLDDDTHLHVSFDVDFLDPDIAPGVGTTVPGGPTYREAQLCMEMIADTGRMASLDVVELNPALDHRNRTAELAVDLIESLFGKSTLMRKNQVAR